jgi:hypothetical protein
LNQRLRAWTHQRQRLGAPAKSAEEALAAVVAVYSAHPTAPLALAARTAGLTAEKFRDLERNRKALRIQGMRGTRFLVPRASAGRVFASFRISPAQFATRLRRNGMNLAEYREVSRRVVASAHEPRLPAELQEAAGVKGFEMSVLLSTIRGEGRLLAVSEGSLRVATLRYVATESWAPRSLDVEDVDAALAELAADYLRGYGPARVADFAWWTGVAKGAAAKAFAGHGTIELEPGLFLLADDEASFAAVKPPSGSVDLLPKWDPYTMGYAPDGRGRLVHPDNQPRIYVRKGVVAPGQPNIGLPGDGYPVVLIDGQAVGTWNLTLRGSSADLFDSIGAATRRRLDERLAGAAALLGG